MAAMLELTPGSCTSSLALVVGTQDIRLDRLAQLLDRPDGPKLEDDDTDASTERAISSSRSSSSSIEVVQHTHNHKRAISISSSSDEDKPVVTSKRPRKDSGQSAGLRNPRYHRVLAETLRLQPVHPKKVEMNGEADVEAYPDQVDVDLSSWPRTKSRQGQTLMYVESAYLDDIVNHKGLVQLRNARLSKVDGHVPDLKTTINTRQTPLPFHFALTFDVYLDFEAAQNPPTQGMSKSQIKNQQSAIDSLLWAAFVYGQHSADSMRHVETRSGANYEATDIQWFYSCLPRPPACGSHDLMQRAVPDRKGKGRARNQDEDLDEDTGSRQIEPPGLTPSLLPFQSRSLEWMLYREGKAIAGRNEEGKHYVENLPDKSTRASLRRSAIWSRITLEDGDQWFFNPASAELQKEDPAGQANDITEGSMLAEEMGLGKTVEILSLILLNQDPARDRLPAYDAEWLAQDVQPSSLTLLVCPVAIIGQWQDEIARHAPSLRVLRYEGTSSSSYHEVDDVVGRYDIILCDFNTLASDMAVARKPRLHGTRAQKARGNRVAYKRSLLVSIDFLRVILDEAQMAASTTSAISETASWIPRKHSWAVSGTPIKQTIQDLSGLLKFLRVYDVGYNATSFKRILEPEFAEVFTNLVSRLGIRTVKAQIEGELALPEQSRFIVPVEFGPLEQFNYRTKYGEALQELQLAMDSNRVTADWALDRTVMSRWLHVLRRACFHAQAGAVNVGRVGGAPRRAEENVIQTLDDVLLNLRERNIAELHSDQRNAASARIDRAYRLMHDKEECERFEKALKILRIAKRDLHTLAEDIHGELLRIFPEGRRTTPVSRATSATPADAGHPYLHVFRDAVKDLMDAKRNDANSNKAKITSRLIGTLSNRLREVLFTMHQAVFFIGNAYFAMGDKEAEETAAYAEADLLRKQILHSDEKEAIKEIQKLKSRVNDREKRVHDSDVYFGAPETDGGLQSSGAFDQIKAVIKKANEIAEVMLEWRKIIIEALSSRLTDEEISADEYQKKAELQEQLDVRLECLSRLQADWIQLVTGARNTLSETPTVGGNANQVQDANLAIDSGEGTSRRAQRKAQMTKQNTKKIIAAADPATKLRNELEDRRKEVVPAFIVNPRKQKDSAARDAIDDDTEDSDNDLEDGTCAKEQLQELHRLKERVIREEEQLLVLQEIRRFRKDLAAKDKVIELLKSEVNVFASVYNARVKFFKLMQSFGDAVAELPSGQATPFALARSMEDLKARELTLEREAVPKLARRRFLDSLKENAPTEECMICTLADEEVILTHCGHVYHEMCLSAWFKQGQRTCPVCRASMTREHAWQRVYRQDAMLVEEKDLEKKPEASKPANQAEEIPEASQAGLHAATDDPAKQLHFLDPEMLEMISDMPLQGAPLGSKLDMIVKHVLFLRNKHQWAIERHDTQAAPARSSTTHPGKVAKPPVEAKILIYSGWMYACDVLEQAFRRENIKCVRLEGRGAAKKEDAVITFKEDPEAAVFILHAQSQAAGLTLTMAQYVILCEPLLEVALEVQAIARVHRIGQMHATTVFQYIVPQTVDERIALLSMRRKEHRIFSVAHSTGPVMKSSISTAGKQGKGLDSPSKRKSRARIDDTKDETGIVSADLLTEDDLASLLLDNDGLTSLQETLIQRAAIQGEESERARRAREEREALGDEIARANGGRVGAMLDWDGWELGEEIAAWGQ